MAARASDLGRGGAELQAAAHHHRRLGMAHALEDEELLVEPARLLEAVALHRAVRHHVGLDDGSLVLRLGDAILDLLAGERHVSSYAVAALSASVRNES